MERYAKGLLRHLHELHVILNTEKMYVYLVSGTHFTKYSSIKCNDHEVYHPVHHPIIVKAEQY